MNSSKSFGVRMPLDMYLKMVEVCSKNGVSQTDLVLYALNRVGLFSAGDFKLGGELLNKEKELFQEVKLKNAEISKLNTELSDVKWQKEQAEIIVKKWYNLMEQCHKQGFDINSLAEWLKNRNEEL